MIKFYWLSFFIYWIFFWYLKLWPTYHISSCLCSKHLANICTCTPALLELYICSRLRHSLSFFFPIYQAGLSYACFGSPSWQRFSFTLAAVTRSNSSRTLKRVWGSSTGVILVCVLAKSRSSHIWRLCRASEGLSLDYG